MKYSFSAAALLALGVSANPIDKRQGTVPADLSSTCASLLQSLGFGSNSAAPNDYGVNAMSSGSGVWIGSDGAYTSTFTNESTEEVCLVVWGDQPQYQASFVTAVQPLITVSLAPSTSNAITLSFDDGQSGAWAGIYPNTVLSSNGQIFNTWGEFTMSATGVVDISREVNTNGAEMQIVGPDCTTNFQQCYFDCIDSTVDSCYEAGSYMLYNCDASQQPGAVNGGGTDGGCGWEGSAGVSLATTFY